MFPTNGAGLTYNFDTNDPANLVLTFSGSGSAINTVPGTNDTLARVTVIPDKDLVGPITISIGGDTDFKYDREFGIIPVADETFTVERANIGGNPVPAPPAAVLFVLGGLLIGVRKRLTRRNA